MPEVDVNGVRTFTFAPGDVSSRPKIEEVALRRAQSLITEVESVVKDVEKRVESGFDPNTDTLWGDAVAVDRGAPLGTQGYTHATLFYQNKRGVGAPVGVDADRSISNGELEILKERDYHPPEGGSVANRLGNLLYGAGLDSAAKAVQSLDHGPRTRAISHNVIAPSGKNDIQENVCVLIDGTIKYSTNAPDAWLLAK